ncbi:oligosaccharide flippase family protein [Limosilactobacillus fermentum]|uniref:oligosaccharide flippase family protein n=2 Tax=Limosilactobacillus fermentum TaxID=1613 RepID=UPI0008A57A25|nr:flippase [Lactobacillus sp. HMSC24D01]
MKVIKNYLYNAGYQILVMLVPLITTPYVNRVLGAYGIGMNTFTNTTIQYFILGGSLGISIYGNRQIAYVRDNQRQLTKTFLEIQIVKTIGILVSTALFFLYLFEFARYKEYMLLQGINLIAAAFDISWFFQGLENFKITVVRNMIVKIISTILIFVFVRTSSDTGTYIFILAMSILLGNLTLWPYLKGTLVKVSISELSPWIHIVPSLALLLPQVALQIYQILNRTILGVFISTNASGFYFDADTIIKIALSLITSIGTVMLPHAANEFIKGNKDKINNYMYLSSDITSALAIAFSFGIAAISFKLAPVFFGKEFLPVGGAMFIEAPVIYLAGISGVLGTQYLLPTNQLKKYTVSIMVGAVASICLNLILIPAWGLNGAMVATVSSEASVLVYQLVVLAKSNQLKIGHLFDGFFKYFIAGMVMFIIVFSIDRYTKNGVIELIVEIIVGAIVYLTMVVILKTNIYCEVRKFLNKRVIKEK